MTERTVDGIVDDQNAGSATARGCRSSISLRASSTLDRLGQHAVDADRRSDLAGLHRRGADQNDQRRRLRCARGSRRALLPCRHRTIRESQHATSISRRHSAQRAAAAPARVDSATRSESTPAPRPARTSSRSGRASDTINSMRSETRSSLIASLRRGDPRIRPQLGVRQVPLIDRVRRLQFRSTTHCVNKPGEN